MSQPYLVIVDFSSVLCDLASYEQAPFRGDRDKYRALHFCRILNPPWSPPWHPWVILDFRVITSPLPSVEF